MSYSDCCTFSSPNVVIQFKIMTTRFAALGSILQNYFCRNWTAIKLCARFWCIVWDAQWVFKWTYLCLLLRIRKLSYWWCKFTDANPFSAENNASKIAIFLRQLYYGQIGFIVLVPCLSVWKVSLGLSLLWIIDHDKVSHIKCPDSPNAESPLVTTNKDRLVLCLG